MRNPKVENSVDGYPEVETYYCRGAERARERERASSGRGKASGGILILILILINGI